MGESSNWKKNKNLPYLKSGFHEGFPFNEGFSRANRHGTFKLITAWGELVCGATIKWGKGTSSDPTRWDTSKCKFDSKKSRLHIGSALLEECHVAGWRDM